MRTKRILSQIQIEMLGLIPNKKKPKKTLRWNILTKKYNSYTLKDNSLFVLFIKCTWDVGRVDTTLAKNVQSKHLENISSVIFNQRQKPIW